VLLSSLIRKTLDSVNGYKIKPSIVLPDHSATAIEHLGNLLSTGSSIYTGELNMSEIMSAANLLGVDISNFQYCVTEAVKVKVEVIEKSIEGTDITNVKNADSDSDLDETMVDDYGEDEYGGNENQSVKSGTGQNVVGNSLIIHRDHERRIDHET